MSEYKQCQTVTLVQKLGGNTSSTLFDLNLPFDPKYVIVRQITYRDLALWAFVIQLDIAEGDQILGSACSSVTDIPMSVSPQTKVKIKEGKSKGQVVFSYWSIGANNNATNLIPLTGAGGTLFVTLEFVA